MKPKLNIPAAWEDIQHLTSYLLAISPSIIIYDDAGPEATYEQMQQVSDRLISKVHEAYYRVKGNRPEGTPIVWHDLRLILAGSLRPILEELER